MQNKLVLATCPLTVGRVDSDLHAVDAGREDGTLRRGAVNHRKAELVSTIIDDEGDVNVVKDGSSRLPDLPR